MTCSYPTGMNWLIWAIVYLWLVGAFLLWGATRKAGRSGDWTLWIWPVSFLAAMIALAIFDRQKPPGPGAVDG